MPINQDDVLLMLPLSIFLYFVIIILIGELVKCCWVFQTWGKIKEMFSHMSPAQRPQSSGCVSPLCPWMPAKILFGASTYAVSVGR